MLRKLMKCCIPSSSNSYHRRRMSFAVPSVLENDLHGRDLASLETYTTSDLYSLLWAAIDLKEKKSADKICDGKSICSISDETIRKISLSNAGARLGASTMFLPPSQFSGSVDFEILGKTLGSSADIVFIDSNLVKQDKIMELADGCTSPVICSESSQLSLVAGLSDLMTLHEHYKYLRRLTISFIGLGSDPLLNAYALLLPKLGMHLHFLIDGEMDQMVWEKSIGLCTKYQTQFKQYETVSENLYRAHAISTSSHGHKDWMVSPNDTKEMDLDWTILHRNVHNNAFVTRDLLRCKQSLIWKSIANQTWIYQAIIATKTMKFKPTCARPVFEGIP